MEWKTIKFLPAVLICAATIGLMCGCGTNNAPGALESNNMPMQSEASTGDGSENAASVSDSAEEQESMRRIRRLGLILDRDNENQNSENEGYWADIEAEISQWESDHQAEASVRYVKRGDSDAQNAALKQLIEEQVEAILFMPSNPESAELLCEQARQQGIVILVSGAPGMENIDYDLEPFEEAKMGMFLMDRLCDSMSDPSGIYITMVDSMLAEGANNWLDAAVKWQTEAYPQLKLAADSRITAEYDADRAFEMVGILREKYPDLSGIVCVGTSCTEGIDRALAESDPEERQIYVSAVRVDNTDTLKDDLMSGCVRITHGIEKHNLVKALLNAASIAFSEGSFDVGTDLGAEGFEFIDVQDRVLVGNADFENADRDGDEPDLENQ